MSTFLQDLKQSLDEQDSKAADALVSDFWGLPQPTEFLPIIRTLAAEIGIDRLLAEATLAWVRMKKAQVLAASLGIIYTPEQLAALQAKAAEEAAEL